MFLFYALADLLGSPSVPQPLSPCFLPEEGALCFQRRKAIAAGSASPPPPMLLRGKEFAWETHLSPAMSWPRCCLLGASTISRVKPPPNSEKARGASPPFSSSPRAALAPRRGERWGYSEHALRHFCFLVLLGGFRCTRG